MECDCDELIRQVGVQSENAEQHSENDEWKRHQVPTVLRKEIVDVQPAPGQEVPLVCSEPEMTADDEEEDERHGLDGGEGPAGDALAVETSVNTTRRMYVQRHPQIVSRENKLPRVAVR
jgi:hypothetical protein